MRWPFGPPHLTLKPSKKTKKKTKKNKKKNKTKNNKKKPKNKNQERKSKKHKKPKKRAFQLSVKNFLFFDRVSKNCFFDTLAQKTRTPKHYKNRGFSLFFWKKVMRHETAIFGQKNPNSEIPVIIFFLAFFSLSKTKNTKICWNPYFYSVLANLKKENFPKINLKHRNLKNPFLHPFLKKAIFR